MAIHADGDVALDNQSGGMDVGGGLAQLQVQMELDKKVERDFIIARDQRGNFSGVEGLMFRPTAEIRGAEFVAQKTKDRVRREPVFVFGEEILVGLIAEGLSFLQG